MTEAWRGYIEGTPLEPALIPLQEDSPDSYLARLKEILYKTSVQHALLDGYATLEELGMGGYGLFTRISNGISDVGEVLGPEVPEEIATDFIDTQDDTGFTASSQLRERSYSLPQGSSLLNSSLGTLSVVAAALSSEGNQSINAEYQRVRDSRPIKLMERVFGKDITDSAYRDVIKRHEERHGKPKTVEEMIAGEVKEVILTLKESIDPFQMTMIARQMALLLFQKYGIDTYVSDHYSLLLAKKYSSQITYTD